jgi:hypothetical protein
VWRRTISPASAIILPATEPAVTVSSCQFYTTPPIQAQTDQPLAGASIHCGRAYKVELCPLASTTGLDFPNFLSGLRPFKLRKELVNGGAEPKFTDHDQARMARRCRETSLLTLCRNRRHRYIDASHRSQQTLRLRVNEVRKLRHMRHCYSKNCRSMIWTEIVSRMPSACSVVATPVICNLPKFFHGQL